MCECQANAKKQEIKLIVARSQLQSLLNAQDDSSECEHMSKINDVQRQICSLENAMKQGLPPNFSQNIQAVVAGFILEGRSDVTFEIAPTQADPCLAQLTVSGKINTMLQILCLRTFHCQ